MGTPKHLAATPATRPVTNATTRGSWPRGLCVFLAVVALVCSLYAECVYEIAGAQRTGVGAGFFYGALTLGSAVRAAGGFMVLFALLVATSRTTILEWLLLHRRAIALALLAILVLLEISGSSLALWGPNLGEQPFNGTLFGLPRTIRSDEWLVFTPFSLAQGVTGNEAISSVIRGGGTDVTMVYAQPSWSLATAFRPFLWGYLVLGTARGLSFFWCARALALVLVTYDCMTLLCDGRRRLAAYASLLVAFAPLVEWWFAVNGTAELFVFGQGLVLSLHYLLRAPSTARRWAWSALLGWLLGCYALIFYPAWQVPLVYVFGAMGIAVLMTWLRQTPKKQRPRARSVLVPALVCAALAIAAVALCLVQSWDALQATMSSAYPGQRLEVGGGLQSLLPDTVTPLLSALWPEAYPMNVCTSMAFFALFPLGLVAAVAQVVRGVRNRAHDPFLVALLCAYAILGAYGILGFDPMLARLTLLSNVPTGRLPMATGYLDVALLARSLAVAPLAAGQEAQVTTPGALAHDAATGRAHAGKQLRRGGFALVFALRLALMASLVALGVMVAQRHAPELMGIEASVALAVMLTICLLPLALPREATAHAAGGRDAWLLGSAALVVVCSLCVNPIQRGVDALTQSSLLSQAKQAAQEEPEALWLTDHSVMGQALITAGIPTITCVNVYPNLERWHTVDPDGAYEEQYNRYAHLKVALGDKTSFNSPDPDMVDIILAPDDVPKLGATFWLSSQDLASHNTERVRFEPAASIGGYTLYRIQSVA